MRRAPPRYAPLAFARSIPSRRFRILAVIDVCCHENLCLMADTSISGARVARVLDALVRLYGKPDCIVSDRAIGTPLVRETMARGTEVTSRVILKGANDNEVDWHYIDLRCPAGDL